MCIAISENAKKWTQKKVYKLVSGKGKKTWRSAIRDKIYRKGEIYRLRKGAKVLNPNIGYPVTKEGIYVYKTLNYAKSRMMMGESILAFEVDPEDFLYTDGFQQATYRKVKCLGKVY